jgi:uncharacterized protein (DUF2237 family)
MRSRERGFLLGRVRSWPDSTWQPSISAPPVILQSTHEAALDVVDLADLKRRALELS